MSTSKTSAGALRHAQSFVTSSQPDGSASPMGIRQLKTQEGCDMTAGRAVMEYSGEEELAEALMAMVVVIAIPLAVPVDVDDWAMARATWRENTRSLMIDESVDSCALI